LIFLWLLSAFLFSDHLTY